MTERTFVLASNDAAVAFRDFLVNRRGVTLPEDLNIGLEMAQTGNGPAFILKLTDPPKPNRKARRAETAEKAKGTRKTKA